MANRYIRNSGNWNDTNTWSATNNGTAGASVPTASDIVYLSQANGRTVTLTADAECLSLVSFGISAGGDTISLGQYKLHIYGDIDSWYNGTVINMGTGTLELEGDLSSDGWISEGGTIIFNVADAHYWESYGRTLNNVQINFITGGLLFDIYGNPTVNSLVVQNKVDDVFTLSLLDGITLNKFAAKGYPGGYKLQIFGDPDSSASMVFNNGGTCFGDNLQIDTSLNPSGTGVPFYIGSNSIADTFDGWLTQNPPKISTLVDPLTTSPGSNSNFNFTGSFSPLTDGLGGGGYKFTEDAQIVSTNTYDLRESSVVFEVSSGLNSMIAVGGGGYLAWSSPGAPSAVFVNQTYDGYTAIFLPGHVVDGSEYTEISGFSGGALVKISLDSSHLLKIEVSLDGTTWTTNSSLQLTLEQSYLYASLRINAVNYEPGEFRLFSVNCFQDNTNTGAFLQFF